jgi:hypothetical protein
MALCQRSLMTLFRRQRGIFAQEGPLTILKATRLSVD